MTWYPISSGLSGRPSPTNPRPKWSSCYNSSHALGLYLPVPCRACGRPFSPEIKWLRGSQVQVTPQVNRPLSDAGLREMGYLPPLPQANTTKVITPQEVR